MQARTPRHKTDVLAGHSWRRVTLCLCQSVHVVKPKRTGLFSVLRQIWPCGTESVSLCKLYAREKRGAAAMQLSGDKKVCHHMWCSSTFVTKCVMPRTVIVKDALVRRRIILLRTAPSMVTPNNCIGW